MGVAFIWDSPYTVMSIFENYQSLDYAFLLMGIVSLFVNDQETVV